MKKVLTIILLLAIVLQGMGAGLAAGTGLEKAAEFAELAARTPAEKEFLDYMFTVLQREYPNFSNKDFTHWSTDDKTELLRQLVANEYLASNDQISKLLRGQMEDDFISDFVDKTLVDWLQVAPEDTEYSPVSLIGFNSILQKIWGNACNWSHEQRAWYSQAFIAAGKDDYVLYLVPDSKHIPEKMAIRAAQYALEIWTGELPGTFDECHIISQFQISSEDYFTAKSMPTPVWDIELQCPNHNNHFVAVDSLTGMVDNDDLFWNVRYFKYREKMESTDALFGHMSELTGSQGDTTLFTWPLDGKAEWSETRRPIVLEKERTEPGSFDYITVAFSQYAYGLPDESAMSEEDALKIGKEAIIRSGNLDAEKLELYNLVYTYYDVTDGDQPKWRFHFSAYGINADLLSGYYLPNLTNIRVEVDAYTGEILSLEQYRQGDYTGYEAILKWL